MGRHRRRPASAFTLVELLVVVSIIGLLISIIVPSLTKSKKAAVRVRCLAHLRQLQTAVVAYAADREDQIIAAAGDGTEQGGWLGALKPYGAIEEARRCSADQSPYFNEPLPNTVPPRLRTTSYVINDYVSPTHTPFGVERITRLSQVRRASRVIHLAELVEKDDDPLTSYAGTDHLHVENFFNAFAPHRSIELINRQMPLGRHGGKPKSWDAVLNFSFLDGHADSHAIREVYTSRTRNLFDPAVAGK